MYSWNQCRPPGSAIATSSIEVVPIVDNAKGIPAAVAAVAPAISPSACIIRVNPVGAIPKGSAARPPRTSREVSTAETSRRIEGWNSTSRKAWRALDSETSPSAAPSV